MNIYEIECWRCGCKESYKCYNTFVCPLCNYKQKSIGAKFKEHKNPIGLARDQVTGDIMLAYSYADRISMYSIYSGNYFFASAWSHHKYIVNVETETLNFLDKLYVTDV